MNLVYKNERTLFSIMLAISVLAWVALVLGTFGVALVYALFFFIAYCFAQSAFISHIKGTGVKITAQQFPDLQARIGACCDRLDMPDEPDAYIMHMGGVFNAFATRFFGRNFIVLYSDIVDALDANPDALNFYIGHELGHIKRKHNLWSTVLMPASLLPLIGAAYSRAREYTCDRHGLAACEQPTNAQFGLAALAAGGKRWRTMSKTMYVAQGEESRGFWMSFHELVGDYPWLVKRMGAVKALANGQEAEQPSRHPLAVVLALFVPRVGAGGAGALVTVMMIGILAAVALPAYQDYVVKSKVAVAVQEGQKATTAVALYYEAHNEMPATPEAAGVSSHPPGGVVQAVSIDPASGVVRLSTALSASAPETIEYAATLDANHRIIWKCSTTELAPRFVPPGCN